MMLVAMLQAYAQSMLNRCYAPMLGAMHGRTDGLTEKPSKVSEHASGPYHTRAYIDFSSPAERTPNGRQRDSRRTGERQARPTDSVEDPLTVVRRRARPNRACLLGVVPAVQAHPPVAAPDRVARLATHVRRPLLHLVWEEIHVSTEPTRPEDAGRLRWLLGVIERNLAERDTEIAAAERRGYDKAVEALRDEDARIKAELTDSRGRFDWESYDGYCDFAADYLSSLRDAVDDCLARLNAAVEELRAEPNATEEAENA